MRTSAPRTAALIVAGVAGAAALTWAVRLFAADTLYVFFFAAVALSAWGGGTRAGLVATVCSALVVDDLFIPPPGILHFVRAADGVRLVSFTAVAALTALLTGALHRARVRADRLWAEAEAARAAADRASAAKGDFLATMSHELRTPINAVLGYADLLEVGVAGPVSAAQVAYLGRLRTAGRHLLGLVNDVLDLATVDAGHLAVERIVAPLATAAADAVALVVPQAAAKGIRLIAPAVAAADGDRAVEHARGDCPGGADATYVGDPERVRQIVVNLLSNAVKFTPAGGSVTLDWGAAGTAARVWVRVVDTGVGIAAADQARVFEPFEQVDPGSRRRAEGTGLGLAISRRLARLMAGDLTLESAPGAGSTFTLWLPAAPHDHPSPATQTQAPSVA